MTAAATSEYSCVRAPLASARAVRDPDDDAGKPPTRPEATCTPASATNSWSGSTGRDGPPRSSGGAGKPRSMRLLSPYATIATPRPATASLLKSSIVTAGKCTPGRPVGTWPTTATPRSANWATAHTIVAVATAMRGPGQLG